MYGENLFIHSSLTLINPLIYPLIQLKKFLDGFMGINLLYSLRRKHGDVGNQKCTEAIWLGLLEPRLADRRSLRSRG
jgi:hypothetical protein